MPSHFKFKEYCPNVFRNLREKFGVGDNDFLVSESGEAGRDGVSENDLSGVVWSIGGYT